MMKQHRRDTRQRGVSLIEALVALAAMAIGMLAIVGVQTTLRTNSDVAKQRSEALRLAQREVEKWRSFVVVGTGGAAVGYADIASGAYTENGVNATFSVARTVFDLPASSPGKSLKVSVDWNDRTGDNAQRVQLSTVVAGVAPELAPTLSIMGEGDAVRRPGGRNRGIPTTAKDLGNGTSGLVPPRSGGNVAWVFDNTTGLIRLCSTNVVVATTGDLTETNITCADDAQLALLVAGFVRFSVPPTGTVPSGSSFTPLTGAMQTEALDLAVQVDQTAPAALAGTVDCFSDQFDTETLYYVCAVPVLQIPGTTPAWSGNMQFDYASGSIEVALSYGSTSANRRKVCRYPNTVPAFSLETASRVNQNFLVIRAGSGSPFNTSYSCPSSPSTPRYQP